MKYLEAARILKNTEFISKNSIKVFSSGELEQLTVFLKAQAALSQVNLILETNSFGTLVQSILKDKKKSDYELIFLFPWDIFPELDWRTGGGDDFDCKGHILERKGKEFSDIITSRNADLVIYCEAPFVPVCFSHEDQKLLKEAIELVVSKITHVKLSASFFSLKDYLKTGFPFVSEKLQEVAKAGLTPILNHKKFSKKVIITDLDNTLWSGVLGEDGKEKIDATPRGKGFKHFIYQKVIKRIKKQGVVLAVVSKNDFDLVDESLSDKQFELQKEDFIKIFASYDPKALHILELSKMLNLPLDSFVFVDDNEVEINQIQTTLPEVTCLKFPGSESDFISFIEKLVGLFPLNGATSEDRNRTELYAMREDFQKSVSSIPKININKFLKTMDMKLKIYDRSMVSFERGLQLINKTNQFNMNGLRIEMEDFQKITSSGGQFLTGELADKSGSHGEVIAALVDCNGVVVRFVMSCRVFDRKLEFVFIMNLLSIFSEKIRLKFEKTERNDPFYRFYSSISDCLQNDVFIKEFFYNKYKHIEDLIDVQYSFLEGDL